jgi:predicted CXXCH cytochrome family protein
MACRTARGLRLWLVLLCCVLPLTARAAPIYAGTAACGACHLAEAAAWRGSHHALAMVSDDRAWLGDFTRSATGGGSQVRFRRDAAGLTAIINGQSARISASFGVYPLQQYLVEAPGGRLQVLPVAWDARPAAQGGQRWFDPARAGAPPWSSRDQTWNFMCADCHSTGVARNYTLATDSYATTTAQENVGCEACHGAGAAHAAAPTRIAIPVPLTPPPGAWGPFDPATHIRHWAGPPRPSTVLDVCAPCHSRRSKLLDRPVTGAPFLDGYQPALVAPPLYFPNGQIEDEVFEYGSFLQSRMYQNGVTCTDCHDPHTAGLRAPGNAVCTQCHQAAAFDTPAHHHHAQGSAGAACAACHMPTRVYMGVHQRHDHALRVPDPTAGAPDACSACHADHAPAWAAAAIATWHLARPAEPPSPIQRAAAVTPDSSPATRIDPDPLVRMAAASQLPAALVAPLLHDPLRAVRVAAARRLPNLPQATAALAEWRAAQQQAADRPESHLNLGALAADQHRLAAADAEFHTALRLDPAFTPAMVDLADLSRLHHQEAAAERWLRQATAIDPTDATAEYALALSLIRQHRLSEADAALRRALALRQE